MVQEFNHEEKKALVAIIKFMINADGRLNEAEIEQTERISSEKGFEDFSQIFNEVDAEIKTTDDLKAQVAKVREETHENEILDLAIQIARADGEIKSSENEIIKLMGQEWHIDVSQL